MPRKDARKELALALKRLIRCHPLDKITVTMLAAEAGVNRQAFYYHFENVYDLVAWIYSAEANEVLGNERTYDTWQQGMTALLEHIHHDRDFVVRTIHSVDPEYAQRFLREHTDRLIMGVVAEASEGHNVSSDDQAFIARFYASGFVGTVVDWIYDGMREKPDELVARLDRVVHGDIPAAVERFSRHI